MKVSYFLTRPTSENETSIYARLCYSGYKFKYYIPESINPKYWNKDSQRAKETKKFIEYPEFNARLNNIQSKINNTYRTYINNNDGLIPTPATFKELLNESVRKVPIEKLHINTFFGFFENLIHVSKNGTRLHPKSGTPISINTIKTYLTTLKHLNQFQDLYPKRVIDFNQIDLEFYSDFSGFLTSNLILGANAIGKDISIIKLVMNEATERKLNTNLAYKGKRFVTVREKVDSIYLTEDEIKEIQDLDLSTKPTLEKVRDLFVIGCLSGLRYSDYSILQASKIKDGFLELTQVKTLQPIIIPIHPRIQTIIDKYNGELPKSISNQKTNNYLKELGKKITSLNMYTIKNFTKGGIKKDEKYFRWELLSTHTARRSFATNEFLLGTPTITIMAVTGHKTEKSFMRYIKVTSTEHAKIMKLHWEKRHSLVAV